MIVGSNQPYFFPYLGYWQLMNLTDIYVISDSMQYMKKSYINRNYILIDGHKYLITLEVLGVHGTSLINEVKAGNNRKKLMKLLFSAYKKAPFFDDVFPLIEEILLNEEKNLARFLGHSLEKIAQYLSIETKFIYLSDLQGDTDLMASARTMDICKRLNANTYINAIGGQELYDKENFLKENIDLKFLKMGNIEYQQYKNEFITNLSIIDIMMFNSKEEIKNMLQVYTLI